MNQNEIMKMLKMNSIKQNQLEEVQAELNDLKANAAVNVRLVNRAIPTIVGSLFLFFLKQEVISI